MHALSAVCIYSKKTLKIDRNGQRKLSFQVVLIDVFFYIRKPNYLRLSIEYYFLLNVAFFRCTTERPSINALFPPFPFRIPTFCQPFFAWLKNLTDLAWKWQKWPWDVEWKNWRIKSRGNAGKGERTSNGETEKMKSSKLRSFPNFARNLMSEVSWKTF